MNRFKNRSEDEEEDIDKAHQKLIDQFFNMTFKPHQRSPKQKTKVNLVPFTDDTKKVKKNNRNFKGTDYAKQYQHDLVLQRKASSINSTCVSGPTHVTASTFVEDPFESESIVLGPIRTINFRKSLPIFGHRMEILHNINIHTVTLIQGSTGCGKTTQVPQYIYDECVVKQNSCNIIITQPRKIAAVTVAHRVAHERGTKLGVQVGYQIGLDRCAGDTPENATQITYCTTGVVLQKIIAAKSLNAYTHIILDEVHERNVETDLLIAIIKRLICQNSPHTKVILMSATMNAEKFRNFFKIPHEDDFLYPPVIDLSDDIRRFPIDVYYLDSVAPAIRNCFRNSDKIPMITKEMYHATTQLLALLLYQQHPQDKYATTIIIFLPGLNEIEMMKKALNDGKFCEAIRFQQFKTFTLHSMLSTEDQKAAFAIMNIPKIILSTNIGESSITIPNVTHVVDFCLTKRQAIGGSSGRLQTLVLDWATQNNCKQRAGRTGRVCRGVVYRMVERDFFEGHLLTHPKPEILEVPLETVILKIKKLDMGSPCEILGVSLDPPDKVTIVNAVLMLKEFGALFRVNSMNVFEYDDGEITFLGEVMASLPCDVRISKLILMGYTFSVLTECIIIGAGLSVQGIFRNSLDNKMKDYQNKLKWADGSQSDLIAILNAFTTWENYRNDKYFTAVGAEEIWCRNNGLDLKNLNEMRLWVEEVKKRLQEYKIDNLPRGHQPLWSHREKIFALKIAFAATFGIGNFSLPVSGVTCERDAYNIVNNLDPRKTVYFQGMNSRVIGCVYEQEVIKALVAEGVCQQNSNVSITFDRHQSERVIVTFQSDLNDEAIAPEVYNAVKLRRLKNGITIGVMNQEETLKYAIDYKFGTIIDSQFHEKKEIMAHPELCPLPTCFEVEMKGYVTSVKSCQKFFFKPFVANGPLFDKPIKRHKEAINEIHRLINYSSIKNVKVGDRLKRGELLVVSYNGNLERGMLLNHVDDITLKVNLMDFGDDMEVPVSKVFRLNAADQEELSKFPPRVFLCRLQEIKPAYLKDFGEAWISEAADELKAGIKDKKATIKIFSIVDDILNVKLYINDENGNEICWNEILTEKGYAVECEESYVSKFNNQDRERRRMMNSSNIYGPGEEFKDKLEIIKKKPTCPDIPRERVVERIRLKGPISPLDIPLKAIVKDVNSYVSIDGSSVNQILLNDNLKDFRPNLCVAAESYLDNENDRVKLRETTVYPNITGLPVLLALMFSPTVQIRRSTDKSRYTTVLSGLGANEDSLPYFEERDCVVNVDFDLSSDDIITVNHLRFIMSKIFYVEPFKNMRVPNLVDGQRETLLRKVKDILMKIVSAKRTPREVEDATDEFDWNIDQNDAIKEAINKDHRNIYELIEYPPLVEMSREKINTLLDHAKDLEQGGKKYARLYNQECKLCNVFWYNNVELEIHLLSKFHQARKAQLVKSLKELENM